VDRKVLGEPPQHKNLKASQLERFQLDLQGSLASRLLRANLPATERANVQAIVNAWTENWARISSQSATQAMPT
jgi:hypothetical protein